MDYKTLSFGQVLILFFCFCSTSIIGQEATSQKDLLDLPNTHLEQDFYLKTGSGNIVPVKVSKARYLDVGFSFEGSKFQYLKGDYSLEQFIFQDKKLLQHISEFHFGSLMDPTGYDFKYNYDENGNLVKVISTSVADPSTSETLFTYENGTLKQKIDQGTYRDGSSYTDTRTYTITKDLIKFDHKDISKSYYLMEGLVMKEFTSNKLDGKTYEDSYAYDDNGYLMYKNISGKKYSFQLNDDGLIQTYDNGLYVQTFEYVYDKYGNWIIAYPLSTSNGQLSGTKFQYYIRQIAYNNGETTGSIDPDDAYTKSQVIKLRDALYNRLVGSKNSGSDRYVESATNVAEGLGKLAKYFTGECLKGDCNDGYGERKYQNGKMAEGFFSDGKPN